MSTTFEHAVLPPGDRIVTRCPRCGTTREYARRDVRRLIFEQAHPAECTGTDTAPEAS